MTTQQLPEQRHPAHRPFQQSRHHRVDAAFNQSYRSNRREEVADPFRDHGESNSSGKNVIEPSPELLNF
jgi:hypothetical protein